MNADFLKITTHEDLASFFGLTYSQLSRIIYKTDDNYKYHQFRIPKKRGGFRDIASPSKKLKIIQSKLKDELYKIYKTKPSAHGFAINKSIVTNAEAHLDKRHLFNIDLSDFFGSIHFGRVRNLFKSKPFNFNDSVSTILAHICCFNNSLPQGAPTSPIISNMIALKLDAQLQHLAKITNSTYTRYVDDITFSFTCKRRRLPEKIIEFKGDLAYPGEALEKIIENNGFKINYNKVRLASTASKMEVTGLKVNEFVNVRREFVRQISSMLNAWKKHGYEAAQKEYNEKYNNKHRASEAKASYLHVVKGKLAFLRNVRTGRDEIFNKLAERFNELVQDDEKFKITKTTEPEKEAINSLWVIEACYDDHASGNVIAVQGSAFSLKNVGIITCAHVVYEDGKILDDLEIFKHDEAGKKYPLKVEKICLIRDVAICSIQDAPENLSKTEVSPQTIEVNKNVKLLGFPAYGPGRQYNIVESKVTQLYIQNKIEKFEIDSLIREGNSGGPIIDDACKAIGVALEGAQKDAGNNGCLRISEVIEVFNSDEYALNN